MSFYKHFLYGCLLLCCCQQVQAQFPHDTTKFNIGHGSAKQLRGKIRVINCFVSAGRKGWSTEEKNFVLSQQEYGHYWLMQQVQSYSQDAGLSIDASSLGLDNDIKLDKIESDKEPSNLHINWVPLVLHAAGYDSLKLFYDSVKSVSSADNIVVLIFAKKPGRSYAQTAGSNRFGVRFLEGAVIYSETFAGNKLGIGTIVHEMLHLFGAWDIYNSITQTPEVERNAKKLFPSSIMLDTHRGINELMVDKLTAWCIGWSNAYQGWFEFFRPRTNKAETGTNITTTPKTVLLESN